jgi:hypothetical protein
MKSVAILMLAGASLLLGVSITSAPASATTIVQLPNCTNQEGPVNADLSTAQLPGPADPHWTVTGTNAAGPTHSVFAAWTALPSYWIQPSTSPTPSKFQAGDYTYKIQFNIPCEPRRYSILTLSGIFAADNFAKLTVNTHPIADCPGPNCNTTPAGGTAFTVSANQLVQGLNTMTVVVHNNEYYSGLAVKAMLSARCSVCCVPLPPLPGK